MIRDIDTQRSSDKPGSARAKHGSTRSILASEGSYTERASVADEDSDWQDEDMMTSPIFKLFEEQENIKQTQAGRPAKKKRKREESHLKMKRTEILGGPSVFDQ
ncbi:hypothetical protein QE152_g19339 [Popillia japonica]|uniref:Uncharacterized protein n=1 Tax=Popillia japonica TaxID=7064 RepID=A0AAW1KTU3_POPJA